MSISTTISSVKNNFTKYLAKGAGITALGIVAYDAHTWGKIQSDVYAKTADADACAKAYGNTQVLNSPSITSSKLKKGVYNLEVDNNARSFINSAIGYFKGFGSMLISSVIPLGLGLGALCTKGKWSKGFGIGLGVFAGIKLFKDVLGFGHYNDLNRKF